jgi:hypothetical protein
VLMIRKMAPTAPKKDFVKLVHGFTRTTWSKAGEVVCFSERQTKYPLLHGWIKRK